MEFEIDVIKLFQTVMGVLITTGVIWLIRRVSSTKLEVITSAHEIKVEVHEGFRALNGRLGKLEEHMLGHEQLDEERFESAKRSREILRERQDDLKNQMKA